MIDGVTPIKKTFSENWQWLVVDGALNKKNNHYGKADFKQ
jgi:hypothetical protein